jgi:hypothetical protein
VKLSNVLAKHTITAQSCGIIINIINLLRQLQVDFKQLLIFPSNSLASKPTGDEFAQRQ